MIYQIIAILIVVTFYAFYFAKILIQKRQFIKTNQMGTGNKPKRVLLIERIMSVATVTEFILGVSSIFLMKKCPIVQIRVIGVVIGVIAVIFFDTATITMKSSWRVGIPEEKTVLITNGIYKWSRNPAFVGFDLLYFSMCLMFFNIPLMLASIWAMVMLHLQILQEEAYAIFLMLGGCKANGNNNDAINTTGYMVLIGEDSAIVDKVRDVDILVIDASYFSKEEIDRLKSNNIDRIYSYLNIGSIENFRSYYADYEEYTIGDYENWPEEKWIDVSQHEWKEFVLKESIELSEKGIDGFFIDNVDVYYQYQNDNIYDGLIDILYDIKTLNKPIIINGGDTFIKKYLESGDERVLFDGVNQECVYTTYDFINGCYKKNSKKEKQYFTEYLDMLVENGYLVYVLEYAIDSNIADSAYFYAKKHNYICYVSDNIDLQICE